MCFRYPNIFISNACHCILIDFKLPNIAFPKAQSYEETLFSPSINVAVNDSLQLNDDVHNNMILIPGSRANYLFIQ